MFYVRHKGPDGIERPTVDGALEYEQAARERAATLAARAPGIEYVVRDGWGRWLTAERVEPIDGPLPSAREVYEDPSGKVEVPRMLLQDIKHYLDERLRHGDSCADTEDSLSERLAAALARRKEEV